MGGGKDERRLEASEAPAGGWSEPTKSAKIANVEDTSSEGRGDLSSSLSASLAEGRRAPASHSSRQWSMPQIFLVLNFGILAIMAALASWLVQQNAGSAFPSATIFSNSSSSVSTSTAVIPEEVLASLTQLEPSEKRVVQDHLKNYDAVQILQDVYTKPILEQVAKEKDEIRIMIEERMKSDSEMHGRGGHLAQELAKQNREYLAKDRWYTIQNRGAGNSPGLECTSTCIAKPIMEWETKISKSRWRFLQQEDDHYAIESKDTRFKLNGQMETLKNP